MTHAPRLSDLVGSFADAKTPQTGADAFFAALAPLKPLSLVLTDANRETGRDTTDWDEAARVMCPALQARPDLVAAVDANFPLTLATRRQRKPFRWSTMGPDFTSPAHERAMWQACRAISAPDSDGLVVSRFEDGWLVATLTIGFDSMDWTDGIEADVISATQAFLYRFSHWAGLRPLSKRERDCLHWVAEGKSDFEASVILGISPQTVRTHVEAARRKLAARNRVEAVARFLVATREEARGGQRVRELTHREHVCLFRALYGATDEEIGASMGIAPATVHRHLESAKAKLNVRTRAQAVAELARRSGL